MYSVSDRNDGRAPSFVPIDGLEILDPRVSATTPSRWTITPLFYSQSTDLPVLRMHHVVRDWEHRKPLQTGAL